MVVINGAGRDMRRMLWSGVIVLMLSQSRGYAQDRVGGHFGVALPLVTRAQGQTTTLSDDFVIVFPTGITVRKSDVFAFDLELAPVVQNDPRHIDLTLHPGVAWGIGNGFSVGGHVAFDIGRESWGFTPLFNRGLVQMRKDTTFFGELDVPIRFKEDSRGNAFTSIGLAVVVGVGF
jgi:hypothetical protein